jgi:hypothetical protein
MIEQDWRTDMLDKLLQRGASLGEQRATTERARIAAAITDAAGGARIEASVEGDSIALSGRSLRRRLALDPALRWLIAEARNG